MGEAATKLHPATYADLEAVPSNRVAELVEGTLYTFPRPAPRHANAEGALQGELFSPFQRGRGGPGGWWILPEPELRFQDPVAKDGILAVSPDIAGWRRERMPKLPRTRYFSLAPDWLCEVLSPCTEAHDRSVKMPLYAREGVGHVWLVDPVVRTLEVYRLTAEGWLLSEVHRDDALVRAEPFEVFELDLAVLWAAVEGDEAEDE